MITGTISYRAADSRVLARLFGARPTLALWQGALIMAGLGAVVGLGLATLIAGATESGEASAYAPWGALVGAVLLVTLGAARLSGQATPPGLDKPQVIELDETGIRLRTERADTLMRWPYFLRREVGDELVALKSEDNTIVLFRRDNFASAADFTAARQLVIEHGPGEGGNGQGG